MTVDRHTDPDTQARIRQWLDEGLEVEEWVSPPGEQWTNNGHDTDEILLVLEGRLDVTIDGTLHTCEAGQDVRIPAGVPHSTLNPLDRPCRMVWAHGYTWNGEGEADR